MRITKKEVYGMFKRFLRAINEREATSYNDKGAYYLEHNGTYGGYMVAKCLCEAGSSDNPFLSKRLPAREMYEALYMACIAVEFYKGKQEDLNKYGVA